MWFFAKAKENEREKAQPRVSREARITEEGYGNLFRAQSFQVNRRYVQA